VKSFSPAFAGGLELERPNLQLPPVSFGELLGEYQSEFPVHQARQFALPAFRKHSAEQAVPSVSAGLRPPPLLAWERLLDEQPRQELAVEVARPEA